MFMERRVIGLIDQKSTPNPPILGYSDTSTVKIDFDDTTFKSVKYWSLRAMKWFKLRGFIVLKSSKNHYHVVFDRTVTWKKNLHIIAWIGLESGNTKIQRYLTMQCIKESSTLRISSKKDKPAPRLVFRYGEQCYEIKKYFEKRKLIRNIIQNVL